LLSRTTASSSNTPAPREQAFERTHDARDENDRRNNEPLKENRFRSKQIANDRQTMEVFVEGRRRAAWCANKRTVELLWKSVGA